MKKMTLLVLAGALFCSCQQQAPRNTIQVDVPTYTVVKKYTGKKSRKAKRARKQEEITEVTMVPLSGPEAREWDMFDRADAVMAYNQMQLKDKETLFEAIARVYSILPEDNTLSSELINTGIWKEVTEKGVNLSFGKDPADWHPYTMYIHPIVVAEMTQFFLEAREGSISNEELDNWQKAFCNLINARPDNMSMAALLSRREDFAKAGIIITDTEDGFLATTEKTDWDKYREALRQ